MTATYRTCRHCLGDGCIHCNHRGQVRSREFNQADREAVALRRKIFGTDTGTFRPDLRQSQERRQS